MSMQAFCYGPNLVAWTRVVLRVDLPPCRVHIFVRGSEREGEARERKRVRVNELGANNIHEYCSQHMKQFSALLMMITSTVTNNLCYLLQERAETQTTPSSPFEPHIPLLQSLPLLQGSPFASLVGPEVIGMPVGCGVGRFG